MWRAVWRIELRKTVPYFVPLLVVATPYVLMRHAPFGSDDMAPFAFAVLMGILLAARLFHDAPGTRAFVFSLPLSRTRLFWYRWALGVGMIAVAAAVFGAVLATGLREAAQSGMNYAVWYPMVRWRELGVLWPVAAGAVLGYQSMAFVTLRWRQRAAGGVRKGLAMFLAAAVAMLVACGALLLMSEARASFPGDSGGLDTPARWALITSPAFVAWLIVLTVTTTASCLSCYRRLEIEA